MENLKFKTNILCEGCLSKVRPVLDGEKGIEQWEVDLESPEKTLRLRASGILPEKIAALVKSRGFEITPI